MFNYVGKCLGKYFTFRGRARRKEYWSFVIFVFLINAILLGVAYYTGNYQIVEVEKGQVMQPTGLFAVLSAAFDIALFFPSLSVSVRRLHDIGKSAWWILWSILLSCCCCGPILWLIFTLKSGTDGENKYGEDPRD